MGETNLRSKIGNRAESGAIANINLAGYNFNASWGTVASFSLTTSGNPVMVGLLPAGSGTNPSQVRLLNLGNRGDWRILRDGAVVIGQGLVGEFSAFADIYSGVAAFNTFDLYCPAGAHTFQFQAGTSGGTGTAINYASFFGIELG